MTFFGFTRQEQSIVLFLISSLLIGVGFRGYQAYFSQPERISVQPQFTQTKASLGGGDTMSALIAEIHQPANEAMANDETKSLAKQQNRLKVDINSANEKMLIALPKIGPALAKRILKYRQENGPFSTVDELRNIKGIGQLTLERIRPFIILKKD